MKKILVPTDLSSVAELGLQLAVSIAQKAGASIQLVNFTKHPLNKTFTAMGDAYTKTDDEATRFGLQLLQANKIKMKQLVSRYANDAVIDYAIVDDDFKHGIDQFLFDHQIDLVVLGTSGQVNAREYFTGNHAEQVIRISKCPVISVRDDFRLDNFKNIVLAITRIDEEMILHGVSALRDLVQLFDAKVHLVHVRYNIKESTIDLADYLERIAAICSLTKYSVNIIEAHDNPEGVMIFARHVNAGLIAIIKHSRDSLFHIFSPHFTDRMVKESARPVVTLSGLRT